MSIGLSPASAPRILRHATTAGTRLLDVLGVALALISLAAAGAVRGDEDAVRVHVDASAVQGPLAPIWTWFGNDEPNYAYMHDGAALLTELSAASPVPIHFRTHNLLTSGDGTPALKWGSTNVYSEDADGRPIYDWTILDRILDTYRARHVIPLFQLGFMPKPLSSHPEPYQHQWSPGGAYNNIYTGWAYPPRDYDKWRELVYEVGRHVAARYGREEVRQWLWEVWNEPDIGYWQGTPDEYMRLYDYAVDGLKRALPDARIGGPEVTGPNGARTQTILRNFLEHCLRGTNPASGKTGSPLDLVTFHAKGAPQVMPDGHVRMNVGNQLRAIDNGFAVVASFPELARTPIVLGESDPEGCAACPVRTNPANAYRNGTMFSSYTAEQLFRTAQLAERRGVNLLGAVSWAFEFEGQPYFDGFRDLATNGIDKPVLNVFRMLGLMRGNRVAAESSGSRPLDEVRDQSVRNAADVSALATADAHSLSVMIWNYHDDDLPAADTSVTLAIDGLVKRDVTVTHYRIDGGHSNSYSAWKKMGSPQTPTATQRAALIKAGQLQMLSPPAHLVARDHRIELAFPLPRQAVSLVRLAW